MTAHHYQLDPGRGHPIKRWTRGVPVDQGTAEQLRDLSSLPFIHRHVAAMPDVHLGKGAAVGAVFATRGAIIPAAVGVDIGCGVNAVRLTLDAAQLPDNLRPLRDRIESAIPVGTGGDRSHPLLAGDHPFNRQFEALLAKHPALARQLKRGKAAAQLGTLGSGNHFIELCLDEADRLWVMLHSGSRGAGNRIGTYFIELARRDMERHHIHLPNRDLAYLQEGSDHYDDYIEAVAWAQEYARLNRQAMMDLALKALRHQLPPFEVSDEAINCHHNYVRQEEHFGARVWVTRKGAIRAGKGELGIIPGSMATGSFIVRGKGNPESFCSCSHGAGRVMSRREAKRRISLDDHIAAMAGIEGRRDRGVLDESPAAYKDLSAVMAAQEDLVEVVHRLRPVVNIKG